MKMRQKIATLSLVAGSLFAGTIARADVCNTASYNLISNCSFETGDFTGWSGTSKLDANSGVDTVNTAPGPYAGQDYAYLGSIGTTASLSQTVTTIPGNLYRITFALSESPTDAAPYNNLFQAVFGGATLLSEANVAQSGYTLLTYFASATGTSTTLNFLSQNDTGYFNLDSVSVSEAPEPSSLVLLGTGALGLIGAARRRLKA